MSKFFGYANGIDSHNKTRKTYLASEEFWITQCDWLHLCAKVAIVMTVTNFWKLFHNGVKREHYYKVIGIR